MNDETITKIESRPPAYWGCAVITTALAILIWLVIHTTTIIQATDQPGPEVTATLVDRCMQRNGETPGVWIWHPKYGCQLETK